MPERPPHVQASVFRRKKRRRCRSWPREFALARRWADDLWLNAKTPGACELERPLLGDALAFVANGEKEEGLRAPNSPGCSRGAAAAGRDHLLCAERRSRGGVDGAHLIFRGACGLGSGVRRHQHGRWSCR